MYELIIVVIGGIILGVFGFIWTNKNTKKTKNALEGKKLELPEIEVSEEIDQQVKSLIDFVYEDGSVPSSRILSKKNQHNILCQTFLINVDLAQYETFVQGIYERIISKNNTYKNVIDKEEWYGHLRFAFETTVSNIIQLTADKTKARDCFKAIDNMTERLLQMNEEKFKDLFFRLREYHFWYVYNQDEDYKFSVERIKKRLKFFQGIKQSDYYAKETERQDDVSYVLYFAEKAGEIVRKKDGRSYRLFLPEDKTEEIRPYEFTRAAASDIGFNYRDYWKKVESVLKDNEGILQTEFYNKFDWDSEVLTRVLRDADKDGKVFRQKKGNTYSLYLSKPSEESAEG